MLLFLLVFIPFLGGFLSWQSGYLKTIYPRWIALITMGITLFISLKLWFEYYYIDNNIHQSSQWNLQFLHSWIPSLGINFHLALDGLSLLFVIFIAFLGFIAVLCSWKEIKYSPKGFYFNLLCIISGGMGVFLSIDLFLFFCFWELILIPMYFLIAIWGSKDIIFGKSCVYSANKFFIYAHASSLLMLLSIIGLALNYYNIHHTWSFDYNFLLNTSLELNLEWYLMLGFFLSFIVKLPVVPFHTWLLDAHSHAPTAGSIDLVGLVVKSSSYGLLRFCIPLFPHASVKIIPLVLILGVVNVFYGALLAFWQKNIKRLLAYSSISNMGFVLLAIYTGNLLSYQGAIINMIAYGLSSSALFILAGQLYERLKTMNIYRMGGLWSKLNWISGSFLFFSMATVGIPGTGNFIAELMMLLGIFKSFPLISCVLAFSLILASIYSLNMFHTIFYGKGNNIFFTNFIYTREIGIILCFVFLVIFIGLYPEIILKISYFSIKNIQNNFSFFLH
ncbi:NADH-quinone oxidoreductase subunit M [Buchnera aphidicola (Eriosoma grossulariae)]|uniref:NADH-quinone oxidoreductase subunit M n=1 Tax=Buchnera aphidicola TaxID=9 RepID=UPI003463AB6E